MRWFLSTTGHLIHGYALCCTALLLEVIPSNSGRWFIAYNNGVPRIPSACSTVLTIHANFLVFFTFWMLNGFLLLGCHVFNEFLRVISSGLFNDCICTEWSNHLNNGQSLWAPKQGRMGCGQSLLCGLYNSLLWSSSMSHNLMISLLLLDYQTNCIIWKACG